MMFQQYNFVLKEKIMNELKQTRSLKKHLNRDLMHGSCVCVVFCGLVIPGFTTTATPGQTGSKPDKLRSYMDRSPVCMLQQDTYNLLCFG